MERLVIDLTDPETGRPAGRLEASFDCWRNDTHGGHLELGPEGRGQVGRLSREQARQLGEWLLAFAASPVHVPSDEDVAA